MATKGYDLYVTRPSGDAKGFFIAQSGDYGPPCTHSSEAPQLPMNVGSGTPADTPGGVYDVRDASGEKSITHLDWRLGAGQKTLDGEGASPYSFLESESIDIESGGQMKLLRTATYTQIPGATGPVYSFKNTIFLSSTNGTIKYSTNGSTWTNATFTGTAPTIPPGSFTSDGEFVYMCIPSTTESGVWKGTSTNGAWNFAKIGSSSNEDISAIVYHSGYIYAAKSYITSTQDASVAVLDPDNNYAMSTLLATPSILKYCVTSALVAAGNEVYWVVSNGGQSFVYKIYYDPVEGVLASEQFGEFPTGYVATCASGYVSHVFVGGYWQSSTPNVGMGSVYDLSSGYSVPLFSLGERPEHTISPSSPTNDNRIYAIAAGAKDIYFTTNRAVYRWDIDDGGYSHAFALNGSGYGESTVAWEPGSTFSWDGVQYTSSPVKHLPPGWTDGLPTPDATWDYTTKPGVAIYGPGLQPFIANSCSPTTTGLTLSNLTGSTLEIKTDTLASGELLAYINDGVKGSFVHIERDESGTGRLRIHRWARVYDSSSGELVFTGRWEWTGKYTILGENESFAGMADYSLPYEFGDVLTLAQGTNSLTSTVTGAQTSSYTTYSLKPTATNNMSLAVIPGMAIDYIKVNSADAVDGTYERQTLSYASSAYHNGNVVAPFAVPTYSSSLEIDSIVANNPPTVTTVNDHGLTTGMYVQFSETGTSLDGNHYAITRLANKTFTVTGAPAVAASTGWVYKFNHSTNESLCKEGVAVTGDLFPDTGSLTQSETTFHSGSMMKDFRSMEVLHEPMGGESLGAYVWIDGKLYELNGTYGESKTSFPINQQGYSIKTKLVLGSGNGGVSTPVIKAINVLWDFVKVKKHKYVLDCRETATTNPHEDIAWLWEAADERSTFNDDVIGTYTGIVTGMSYLKANRSPVEDPTGIVILEVREA